MAPELPERDIRWVVVSRFREGTLPLTDMPIPPATRAKGMHACLICGFGISADRNECDVLDGHAHERCAVIWREESDKLL